MPSSGRGPRAPRGHRDGAPRDRARSLKNQAFVLVLCAQAASGIVGGAAPMALPAIRDYFDTSSAAIQWYAALYSLGFALVLILAGRIGDLFGTRGLLLIGYATFIASIVGSALAPSIGVLLVFRLLQGVGAGVDGPQLSAMVRARSTGHDRTRAFSVFLMVAGGTFMVGQLVSGALITADVGAELALGLPAVHPVRPRHAGRRLPVVAPDAPGTRRPPRPRRRRRPLGGVVPADVPLIQGRSAGWPTWIVLMLLVAAPAVRGVLRLRAPAHRPGS